MSNSRRHFRLLAIGARNVSFIVIAAMMGCSGMPTTAPVTVQVPVAMPCPTSLPQRPVFPTESLALDADIWTIGTALWAERQAREAYEIELATRLKGCIEPQAP